MSTTYAIHARRSTLLLSLCIFGHSVSVYPFWLFDVDAKWVGFKKFPGRRQRGYLHLGLFGINFIAYEPDMPTAWRCRRCGQKVNPRTRRCACVTGPSPWEPMDAKEKTQWFTCGKHGWSTAQPCPLCKEGK